MSEKSSNPSTPKSLAERMGRWMVIATWVALLLLLTFFFSRWLDHQHNPNRDLRVSSSTGDNAELVLRRNRMGHYVAPGLINGVAVTFLLDTGASHIALPDDLAEEMGLRRGVEITSITANGLVKGWMTKLDLVQLGPFSMTGAKATILPSMMDSDVLLGMSFLKHFEMIQKDDQLILRTAGR